MVLHGSIAVAGRRGKVLVGGTQSGCRKQADKRQFWETACLPHLEMSSVNFLAPLLFFSFARLHDFFSCARLHDL